MSSLESLKEAARRHEKREEWQKALDLYGQAIAKLDDQETPDIGLFNRVGDLNARIGRLEEAAQHYERAVDMYVEAELANNAIAVCKKIIRHLPGRHAAYLKMGRIRAAQGFLVDARNNYLTYAEQAEEVGDVEPALDALRECAALDPTDTRVLLALAVMSAANDQTEEALRHLAKGRAALQAEGDAEGVREVEAKAEEIDPSVDLSTIRVHDDPAEPEPAGDGDTGELLIETTAIADPGDVEIEAEFGEISITDDEPRVPEVEVNASSDGPPEDLPL
ncbi:MAG TPA: hypothetical protein VKA74_10440, partial [Myxococcota bacterium]|nr:hypothetical protein [Myxococcota bacterium]